MTELLNTSCIVYELMYNDGDGGTIRCLTFFLNLQYIHYTHHHHIIIITTTTITTTTSLLRLSQTMLKQFLSHEVLDRYSFLFKQKTENSSPDGDSLESWLQSLLAQMQASIEQHVQSAMDNSSM